MSHPSQLAYDADFLKAAAPLLSLVKAGGQPALHDIEAHRNNFNHLFSMASGLAKKADVTLKHHKIQTRDGAEIEVIQVAPINPQPNGPAILHTHGGGFICGSAQEFVDAQIVPNLVQASGVTFFTVNYRLAPENSLDGLVNDAYDALEWLSKNASELGVDNVRIGVMGESAGGGIAAGVALQARDRKFTPPLKKQILIYPMLDDRNLEVNPNIEPFAFWTHASNTTGWSAVLGKGVPGTDKVTELVKYAAPARVQDLSGLPDTYMDCGQLDIFLDEDIEYVQRLNKAGVQVDFTIIKGVPHAWQMAAPHIPLSHTTNAARVVALRSF